MKRGEGLPNPVVHKEQGLYFASQGDIQQCLQPSLGVVTGNGSYWLVVDKPRGAAKHTAQDITHTRTHIGVRI